MFGIIADFLASIITILLPVFASYKALRTSDLTQLTPWLIYWIILSLILLAESWTLFIIGWLPFYSWIRLIVLSYLVLPQTQGAKLLYTTYVEPFIASHERQIEAFIGDLHEQGSKAGLGYLKQLIDLFRQRVLGLPPTRDDAPAAQSTTTAASYAQSLLSRFAMPSARAPTTSDFYSMLSGAVAAATSTSTSTRSTSGTRTTAAAGPTPLIPSTLTTASDKQSFLTTQREKLSILIKALDREQRDLDLAYGNAPALEKRLEADVASRMRAGGSSSGNEVGGGSGGFEMRKNKSDNSFQNIEREELEGEDPDTESQEQRQQQKRQSAGRRTTSGGWYPNTWFSGSGSGGAAAEPGAGGEVAKGVSDALQGTSTSIDRRG